MYFQVTKLYYLYGNERKFTSFLLTGPATVTGLLHYCLAVSVTSNYESTSWLVFLNFYISVECAIISIDFCHLGIHHFKKYTDNIVQNILFMQPLYMYVAIVQL